MRKIFIFFISIIIYGSLFPFSFSIDGGFTERWTTFLFSFHPFTSLGDILGNIVLFIPFGYLGLATLTASGTGRPRLRKILLYGLLLAILIQVLQVYIPSRSPSIADVYWNGLGIILGIGGALFIRKRFPQTDLSNVMNIPLILAAFWLLFQLFPFVPTVDFQEIKNSIKPLVLAPVFKWDDWLTAFTGWLIFAFFTKDFFHDIRSGRLILPLVAFMSLPVRLFIMDNHIDLSDAMAILTAMLVWPILVKSRFNLTKSLTCLLAVTIVVNGLASLDFSWSASRFSWIPFSGFLEGSLFNNTRALFFKIFLYGSLIWMTRIAWPYLRLRSLWIFLLILVIEIIQIYMASHSAEITDPLIILLLASVIRPERDNFSANKKTPEARAADSGPPDSGKKSRKDLVLFLGTVAFITIMMSIIIKLPGVPYNVRELFRLDGLFIAIIPFAVFILWFGMSVPLISKRMLEIPDRHFIRFPLWVMAAGLVSFFLLKVSVTEEALQDIVGAPTIYRHVTFRNMWGDFGFTLSSYISFPALWDFIEYIIRFLALFSPVTFLLCLFYYSADLIRKYEIQGIANKGRLIALSLCLNILYALPWLYLCKYIAFDQSNTDNLNELISRQGFFGMGGGGYLYLLILLLTLNSVLIRQSLYHWTVKLLFTAASAIAGWYLLNLGLESKIEKYGISFSGVDFLLGPDRQNRLDESMLFTRWIILYISCIAILAWGMKFNLSSLLARRQKIQKSHTENTQVKNG